MCLNFSSVKPLTQGQAPAQPRAELLLLQVKSRPSQDANPRTQGALMLEGRLAEKASLKVGYAQHT